MKTVVSLTVNFTQERMCCLLCVCGNDLYFQQKTTLDKCRDVTQTTQQHAACKNLTGRPLEKTSDSSVHTFYFHWLWSGKPVALSDCWFFGFDGYCLQLFIHILRIFWRDTVPHMHIQRLYRNIACTGIYGWMYG